MMKSKVSMCATCREMGELKHSHYVVKVRKVGEGYGYYQSSGRIVQDIERATVYGESKARTMIREAFEDSPAFDAEIARV